MDVTRTVNGFLFKILIAAYIQKAFFTTVLLLFISLFLLKLINVSQNCIILLISSKRKIVFLIEFILWYNEIVDQSNCSRVTRA